MAHSHPVYDLDPHFTIDAVTRAITNESEKTILMQYDHNSERFSFEINRLIEGHDVTLCNKVEVHYTNTDSGRQGVNYGVYEVDDLIVDPDNDDRVVFTWLVSKNATLYSGSLSFLIVFACVEDNVVVYRWNTNINDSVSIARGMNNGETVVEEYPDILAQWKDALFAAATGTNSIGVGPVEPVDYPYIWLDTSVNTDPSEKNIGILTIKSSDGIKQRLYPITKASGIEGLNQRLQDISTAHANDIRSINEQLQNISQSVSDNYGTLDKRIDGLEQLLTGSVDAIAHSLTAKGVSVPNDMSIQDVAALINGITMDIPTALQAVVISTPPIKTEYSPGDVVDTTGMIVTADFGDGVTVPVECYIVSPAIVSKETTEVEVILTVNGVTKSATYSVNVTLISAEDLPAGSLVSVAESAVSEVWYRIVDTDYYGNILLVREECLSETVKYRASSASSSSATKYEDSNLDTYLNDTFYGSLPSSTAAIIQPVDIPVPDSAHSAAALVYLNRRIFALSATEWGKSSDERAGETVEYTDSMVTSVRYWTRQPSNGMTNMAYQINPDGKCNSEQCNIGIYVRPAFCISKNQSMKEIEGGWGITGSATDNVYASLVVDEFGNGTLSGISFAVDSNGNATIG